MSWNYMSKAGAMEFDTRDRNWLNNPISMSVLQRAVKKRQDEVFLNGMKFTVRYGLMHTYPASHETQEWIVLQPADGSFVPYAQVPIKRILDFKFEED